MLLRSQITNLLQIFCELTFRNYFQKYERSRRHHLQKLLSVNGLTPLLNTLWSHKSTLFPMIYHYVAGSSSWILKSGLASSLYTCAALWMAVYDPSATEKPLGTICEEKGISSRFRVSTSSRYDLTC